MDDDPRQVKSLGGGGAPRGGFRPRALLMRLAGEGAPESVPTSLSDAALTLPNFISLGRLLLTPVIIALISLGWNESAFWLFILAALSDALDGFLAKYGASVPTRLGTYLDPAADKILIAGLYITLSAIANIPVWLAILVASRDILIVGGIMLSWILYDRTWIMPLVVGKATTCVQLAFLAAILAEDAFALQMGAALFAAGIAAVAFMTLLSGALYILQWFMRVGLSQDSEAS